MCRVRRSLAIAVLHVLVETGQKMNLQAMATSSHYNEENFKLFQIPIRNWTVWRLGKSY